MMLRMRYVTPKTVVRPDNGTLKGVDGSDENAIRWLDMIQVTPFYLEERSHAKFDPQDSRSLDFRHCAALLLPHNF